MGSGGNGVSGLSLGGVHTWLEVPQSQFCGLLGASVSYMLSFLLEATLLQVYINSVQPNSKLPEGEECVL